MQTFPRIPVQPVLDAIAARGGMHRLSGMGVATPDPDDPSKLNIRRTPAETRALARLRNRINPAIKRGWIDYYVADAVCCENLQVHPAAVYGESWFDFTEALDKEALTA